MKTLVATGYLVATRRVGGQLCGPCSGEASSTATTIVQPPKWRSTSS